MITPASPRDTQNPAVENPAAENPAGLHRAAQRLRATLRINASTSLLGGLVAAVAPATLDRMLGTGNAGLVRVAGTGLVAFALAVVWLAGARIRRLHAGTWMVVAADTTWVSASAVAIALGWFSTSGSALIGLVAAMVATFAVAQSRQARMLRRRLAGASADLLEQSPPVETIHVAHSFPGDANRAWEVITDFDLYAALAPNLSAVTTTAPHGPGLTRTCADTRGREWSESCTLWDPGRRFDVTVHTDAPDYPYPLLELRGSWWVEVVPATTVVGMDFNLRPVPGVRGRAFALLMHAAFPVVLRRILRGWQAAANRREVASRLGA